MTLRANPFGSLLNGVQKCPPMVRVQLVAKTVKITKLRLGVVGVGVEEVEGFDALPLGFVLGGELLGLDNHAVNLLLSESAFLVGDGDGLRLPSTLVSRRNLHDTIGVDLKCNLDPGDTTWGGRNTVELELAEEIVLLSHGTFALEDLNQDGGLVISSSGEDLALAGGDHVVAGNKLGHDATGRFNTESEGSDIVNTMNVQTLRTGEDTTLDSCTIDDSLIRVDPLRGVLSEVLPEKLLNLGDTSGTSNKNDL